MSFNARTICPLLMMLLMCVGNELASQPPSNPFGAETRNQIQTAIPCGDRNTWVQLDCDTESMKLIVGPLQEFEYYTLPFGQPSEDVPADGTRLATWFIDPNGYALVPQESDDAPAPTTASLKPWTQLSGVVALGGNPGKGYTVTVRWSRHYYDHTYQSLSDQQRRQMPVNFQYYVRTTVKDDGTFVIPYVPQGRCLVMVNRQGGSGSGVSGTFFRKFITIGSQELRRWIDINILGRDVEGEVQLTQQARRRLIDITREQDRFEARAGVPTVMLTQAISPPIIIGQTDSPENVLRRALEPSIDMIASLRVLVPIREEDQSRFTQFIPNGRYRMSVQPMFSAGDDRFEIPHVFAISGRQHEIEIEIDNESGAHVEPLDVGLFHVDLSDGPRVVHVDETDVPESMLSESDLPADPHYARAAAEFDRQQTQRRKQLEELAARLDKARTLLQQREERREQIIRRMMEQKSPLPHDESQIQR